MKIFNISSSNTHTHTHTHTHTNSHTAYVCLDSVPEDSTGTWSCPVGYTVSAVDFASFGTPTGAHFLCCEIVGIECSRFVDIYADMYNI